MLRKNQIIEARIAAMSHEGEGIARHEGMAVFVPLTAVGDLAQIQIVKVRKTMAHGILQELLEPSPYRIEQFCPVYRRCGGCSLRHVDYSHEVVLKHDWLRENLRRIGGLEPVMDEPIASPACERYRNKAQYPVRLIDGEIRTGFYSRRSHRLIPVEDCLLQPEFFARVCEIFTQWMREHGLAPYDEEAHTGLVRHLYLRYGETTGQTAVCVVINGKTLPHWEKLYHQLMQICPGEVTLSLSHNRERTNVILGSSLTVLQGSSRLEDELCGIRLALSPQAFYQVNRGAAELLYRAALEYASPGPQDTLLDLYCGAGAVGLSMAHAAGSLIGVEIVPEAVDDARRNAARSGVENARFLTGDAQVVAEQLRAEEIRPQVVLLDPPRKGISRQLAAETANMAPERIVYISCNSATLARDCAVFAEHGYMLRRARMVDLFPRTAHAEAVSLLTKV